MSTEFDHNQAGNLYFLPGGDPEATLRNLCDNADMIEAGASKLDSQTAGNQLADLHDTPMLRRSHDLNPFENIAGQLGPFEQREIRRATQPNRAAAYVHIVPSPTRCGSAPKVVSAREATSHDARYNIINWAAVTHLGSAAMNAFKNGIAGLTGNTTVTSEHDIAHTASAGDNRAGHTAVVVGDYLVEHPMVNGWHMPLYVGLATGATDAALASGSFDGTSAAMKHETSPVGGTATGQALVSILSDVAKDAVKEHAWHTTDPQARRDLDEMLAAVTAGPVLRSASPSQKGHNVFENPAELLSTALSDRLILMNKPRADSPLDFSSPCARAAIESLEAYERNGQLVDDETRIAIIRAFEDAGTRALAMLSPAARYDQVRTAVEDRQRQLNEPARIAQHVSRAKAQLTLDRLEQEDVRLGGLPPRPRPPFYMPSAYFDERAEASMQRRLAAQRQLAAQQANAAHEVTESYREPAAIRPTGIVGAITNTQLALLEGRDLNRDPNAFSSTDYASSTMAMLMKVLRDRHPDAYKEVDDKDFWSTHVRKIAAYVRWSRSQGKTPPQKWMADNLAITIESTLNRPRYATTA